MWARSDVLYPAGNFIPSTTPPSEVYEPHPPREVHISERFGNEKGGITVDTSFVGGVIPRLEETISGFQHPPPYQYQG